MGHFISKSHLLGLEVFRFEVYQGRVTISIHLTSILGLMFHYSSHVFLGASYLNRNEEHFIEKNVIPISNNQIGSYNSTYKGNVCENGNTIIALAIIFVATWKPLGLESLRRTKF